MTRIAAGDFRLLRSLADTHAVSLSAAALRFVQVSPARCAVAYCSERKVKWSAPSARLGHHIPEVIEHCVPMPSLEATLSLVVLPLDSKL